MLSMGLDHESWKEVSVMKKIVVRKAGPVRLTSTARALYLPWDCMVQV
ncbi:hypothetical protein ACFZCK_24410 [Kitasatospora purpeofusca]